MKLNLNLETVKAFALDVWEDLGRTRLSGVAVGLAVALLALTAFAFRPGDGATVASGSPAIPTTGTEDDVSFSVPSEEPMKLSDVNLSAPRDPFQSLDGLAAGGDQTLLPAGQEIVDSVMGTDTSAGSTTGLSTTGTSSLMPLDDLSSTPTAADHASVPEADFDDGDEPDRRRLSTDYSYTADVQFGQVNDLKRYATVQRLGLIPSRKLPLIMYLGVADDHETAVFMVDSRLSQGGEGRCVPKDSLCTFLELTADPAQDEHHFRDADGNEYILRLRGAQPRDGVGRQRRRPRRLGARRQPVDRRRLALAGANPAHVQAVHVELGSVAPDSRSARAVEARRRSRPDPSPRARPPHRARPGCSTSSSGRLTTVPPTSSHSPTRAGVAAPRTPPSRA